MSVVNCHVMPAGGSCWSSSDGQLEIMVTNRSKMKSSPRKFAVVNVPVDEEPSQVNVGDIIGLSAGQVVTVVVKVMDLAAPENIKSKEGKELQKQEAKVCDESACVCLVLWENDVGVIVEVFSYRLVGVGVRAFVG